METLISVIIPVYKVETYLEKCIVSIVEQTYKALEIILVDDGSPDRCGLICDEWGKKDNRIKIIHKKMVGCQKLGIMAWILLKAHMLFLLTVMI